MVYASSVLMAGTGVGGYYELETASYESSDFRWNIAKPMHHLNLKLWSDPVKGSDLYAECGAWSNTSDPQAKFWLVQSHARFWQQHHELLLTAREERHWINSPLLRLVDVDKVKDDQWGPKALALRYDLHDLAGTNASAVVSRYTTTPAFAYIGKINKNIWRAGPLDDSLEMGFSALRKEWDDGSGWGLNWNDVFSGDLNLGILGANFIAEYAISSDLEGEQKYYTDSSAWCMELRGMRIGPLYLTWNRYNYGKYFHDRLSKKFDLDDHNFDRDGYYAEAVFLVPKKTINLTYKRDDFVSSYDEDNNDYDSFFASKWRREWNYAEVYTELVGNLKTKLATDWTVKQRTTTTGSAWLELSSENQFAYARMRAKVKDIYTSTSEPYFTIDMETGVNFGDRWRFYWHLADLVGSNIWSNSFYQLRYMVGWNIEAYFEFGSNMDAEALSAEQNGLLKSFIRINF